MNFDPGASPRASQFRHVSSTSSNGTLSSLRPMITVTRDGGGCASTRTSNICSKNLRWIGASAFTALTARHYATHGWPLTRGNAWLIAVAGVLFLLAFALKGAGWRRLLARGERPGSHALAAANAAASVTGLALPGRFDDVVRIAVARRLGGGACRFMRPHRGFTTRPCVKPRWLRVRGKSPWLFKRRGPFPAGSYFVLLRAADRAGHREKTGHGNRVTFRIR